MHLDGDSFATVAVVFVAVAAFAVASSDENVAVFPYDAFVAVGDDAFHRFHVDAVAVVAVVGAFDAAVAVVVAVVDSARLVVVAA